MKKIRLALALLLAVLFLTGAAYAEEGNVPVDVIMILDYSGSMEDNDPRELMPKAAMNFIDMCSVNGSRVALIPFNLGSEHDSDAEWQLAFNQFRALNDVASREAIRHDLLANPLLHYSHETNGGYAFQKAWEVYSARATDPAANAEAIVLFFTDGVIQVGDAERTQQSAETADQYLQQFFNAGVPIHVIGLQGKGEFDPGWLNTIAQNAGTEAAFIIDNDSSLLHECFSEVFASSMGVQPLTQQDVAVIDEVAVLPISIPNSAIAEVNIRLAVDHPRASFGDIITLTRPDGSPILPMLEGTPLSGDVIAGNSGVYYNLKLIRPEQGEWKLTISAEDAQLVSAEVLPLYDVGIRFRPIDTSALRRGDSLRLEAEFYSTLTGEAYNADAVLYRPERLTVSATRDGAIIAAGFRAETAEDGSLLFAAELPALECGSYSFQLQAKGDGFQCQTDAFALDVINQPPVRTGEDPAPIELSVDSMLWHEAVPTAEISLSAFFSDPDGDDLTFAVTGSNDAASAAVNEAGTLLITCSAAGEAELVITAFDGLERSERSLTLSIAVSSCKTQASCELLLIIGTPLLLLVIILFVFSRLTSVRFRKGEHLVVLIDSEHRYVLPADCYGSGGVTLWRMLVVSGIAAQYKPESAALRRVRVLPKRDQVILRNDKACEQLITDQAKQISCGSHTYEITLKATRPEA